MYKIEGGQTLLRIGRTGENEFRTFQFDVSEWVTDNPAGVITGVYRRPDNATYPVVIRVEGGTASWTVTSTELAVAGGGEIELRITDDEVVGKSRRIPCIVSEALELGEKPQAPGMEWVDAMMKQSDLSQNDPAAPDYVKGREDILFRPSTASVGQTIVVKSVDENGKPTEWEAVDPDGWDIRHKLILTEPLEAGFDITEIDGEPLQLREMYVVAKLVSGMADKNQTMGCSIKTDNTARYFGGAAVSQAAQGTTGGFVLFRYHAIVVDEGRIEGEAMSVSGGNAYSVATMGARANQLNGVLNNTIFGRDTVTNYITGLSCGNNLAAGTEVLILGRKL